MWNLLTGHLKIHSGLINMVIAILLQFQQDNKAEFPFKKPALITPQQNCAHLCAH